jgi:5-formyltetrahydrofolate cyclo-ligase
MTLAEQKSLARKAAALRRDAAHDIAAAAPLARQVQGWLGVPVPGLVVSAYWPMRSEIDPRPAMQGLYDRGCRIALPVIAGKGLPLRFREWVPGAKLAEGPFGAQVPAGGDWLVPGVLLVPLLAFDRRLYRLGYGGGFYDRTLAGLRAAGPVRAAGLAYDAQEMPMVPADALDARLDAIITPDQVLTE